MTVLRYTTPRQMKLADTFKEQTNIRLALHGQGYRVLPTANKIAFQKGWPTMEVSPGEIKRWPMSVAPGGRKTPAVTTAIQMTGTMVGIDLDILDRATVDDLFDMACDHFGKAWESEVLVRRGKDPKELWLFRTDEPYRMWKTPRYDDGEGCADHMIEVYGGDSTRYFSCYGPHSYEMRDVYAKVPGEGGDFVETDEVVDTRIKVEKGLHVVKHWYDWEGDKMDPLHVSPEELPVVDVETLEGFLVAANDLLAARWTKVENTTGGRFDGGVAYDLTEDMVFDTVAGELDYFEAMAYAMTERDARCSPSFLDGVKRTDKSHCRMKIAGTEDDLALQVFDHKEWVQHLPATWAPPSPEERQEKAKDLGAAMAGLDLGEWEAELEEADYDPEDRDRFEEAVQDIISRYAMNKQTGNFHEHRPGVEDAPVTKTAMKSLYSGAALKYERPSKAAAGVMLQRKMHPVEVAIDLWDDCDGRMFDRTGFNPMTRDMIYWDDGLEILNTWHGLPERVPGEAPHEDVLLVRKFLHHLMPDDAELQFFLDWLATKYRAPWKRMCAILFLAPNESGTGRGTLYNMLHEMFGRAATAPRENELKEKFNGWMERSVLGLVNEFGTSVKFDDKRAEYQQMKDLVDPTNNFMSVRRMAKESYRTRIYTSIVAATNNLRGVALDDEDRRFAVVTNGGSLNEVKGWADKFMAIRRSDPDRLTAALQTIIKGHEVLTSEQDLTTPPKFAGWSQIVAANDTDLDIAIKAVVEAAGGQMAWSAKRFCEEVRLELFGDRKARKGDGVRGAVSELKGARAARFGVWHMGQMKHTDRSEKRSVICTDPEWFEGLSLRERGEVLDTPPGKDRRKSLKAVPGAE